MNYPSIEALQANPLIAILTGHTCGEACWHARDEVCRCSCGGQNHGILNKGGTRPERTSRKDGKFYILAGVAPSYQAASIEAKALSIAHFPGLDEFAYGSFCTESTMPILIRKASDGQLKWPEVAAIIPADRCTQHLIWILPAGSQYVTKGKHWSYNPRTEHSAIYSTSI